MASCQQGPGKTVLRVSKWGMVADDSAYSLALRKAYADFERDNPGVELQIEVIPGSGDYLRKMVLANVAGSVPDVVTLDASSAAALMANGVVQPLETSSEVRKEFFPNVLQAFEHEGKQYALPLDFTPMVVYYNKDLFDAAGVPYPQDAWTFSDFKLTAQKLTRGDSYGFKLIAWMPGWVMWLWNGGGDLFQNGELDIASPENEATLDFLTSLVTKDKAAPVLSQAAAEGIDPFANGKCAMEVSGHWALVGYQGAKALNASRIGVAPMPVLRKGTPSQTVFYAAGLAMGRTTKHRELAMKFIRHMTSYQVQKSLNVTGIAVCGRKDIAAESANRDERERKFLQIVPSARPPAGSVIEGYDAVEVQGEKMLTAILNNGVPVNKALADMQAAVRQHQGEN